MGQQIQGMKYNDNVNELTVSVNNGSITWGCITLLLAERAISTDYPCKMWSSETLYLTASSFIILHVE